MTSQIIALMTVLLLLGVLPATADECDRLQDATPDQLISYLNGIEPDLGNAACVTFAINSLGKRSYEPAISVMASLLAFRRPPNAREKQGLYLHIQSIDEVYPAARVLEEMGKKALPAVLEVVKAESSSPKARENAVSVWMEIYKYESPKGIGMLKQEADRADDVAVKRNLKWALAKALSSCNPPDEAECKAKAEGRKRSGQ